MMCVVQKPFVGHGIDYVRNELVDGGLFRNEQTLINQRILRPASQQEIATAAMVHEEGDDEEVEVVPRPAAPKAPVKVKKTKTGLKAKKAKR